MPFSWRVEEIFIRSDTTMVALSGLPILPERQPALARGDGGHRADRPDPIRIAGDPSHVGMNPLIDSLRKAEVGPGENAYAEIGSTWWHLLRRPDEAVHVLGKRLVASGEDNVLWGTGSIFYGSPLGQIDALPAFQIPQGLREQYGYPE